MRLIGLAVVLAVGLALAPLAAEGQQAGKVYRIGILWFGREPLIPSDFAVLRRSLADAGYVEGTNLSFSHRWSGGRPDRFPDIAAELVLKVDVLFAASSPAIRAAKEATTTIPIVIVSVGDPVDAGMVTSLAQPGGNITGVSFRVQELGEKSLELLKEGTPSASRIAVLGGTAVMLHRNGMEVAARSLGVRLQFVELAGPNELDAAFETAARHVRRASSAV